MKVTKEVFNHAILALVADGWLRIEPQDAGVPVVRIDRLPEPSQVKQFEHLVIDRVAQCTGTASGIPLSALMTDNGSDYADWWMRFSRAIADEASTAGLTKDTLYPFVGCLIPTALTVAAPTLTAVYAHSVEGAFWAGLGALMGGIILAISMIHTEPTPRGKAAIAWWRQHGGGLSGMMITDSLPPGAVLSPHSPESLVARHSEPLPKGQVWSSYGGRWHTLKVGSLDAPVWGRRDAAGCIIVGGVVFTGPSVGVGHFAIGGVVGTLIAVAPAALTAALLFGSWLPANRRRAAIPTHGNVTGQIVKRWTYETGDDDTATTYYCVCIDDGASPEGWSFRIPSEVYHQMSVGDIVSVDFNPREHEVEQIQSAQPPSHSQG